MSQIEAEPTLSVIVVSFNDRAALERCLDSLSPQTLQQNVELLVVRDWGAAGEPPNELERRFRQVRWLGAANGSSVPQMRSLGLRHSRGELIALLEDDCLIDPNWCQAVLSAHRSSYVAIGGAVEPGQYRKSLDWAVYFCEYVRFMQPFAGDVPALPGNNVSYKRSKLDELLPAEEYTGGFYEVYVHQALRRSGQLLHAEPTIMVRNANSWTFKNVLNVPFHHGRGFAGMRLAGRPLWRRLPFLGVAICLPLLQIARIARPVVIRRQYLWQLVYALPWVALFAISWSVGEFVGYLFGPGKSLQQWR